MGVSVWRLRVSMVWLRYEHWIWPALWSIPIASWVCVAYYYRHCWKEWMKPRAQQQLPDDCFQEGGFLMTMSAFILFMLGMLIFAIALDQPCPSYWNQSSFLHRQRLVAAHRYHAHKQLHTQRLACMLNHSLPLLPRELCQLIQMYHN